MLQYFSIVALSLSTRLHVDAIVNTLYKNCVLFIIRVQYGMRESVACVACCIKRIIIRMNGDEKKNEDENERRDRMKRKSRYKKLKTERRARTQN